MQKYDIIYETLDRAPTKVNIFPITADWRNLDFKVNPPFVWLVGVEPNRLRTWVDQLNVWFAPALVRGTSRK